MLSQRIHCNLSLTILTTSSNNQNTKIAWPLYRNCRMIVRAAAGGSLVVSILARSKILVIDRQQRLVLEVLS